MLTLAVPTYEERGNIEPLVQRIEAALHDAPFELIVVDDASRDGTAAEVRRLQAGRPWLRLLERHGSRDLSSAVVEAWQAGSGDILGCMDADLQHPPELLPAMLQRLRTASAAMVVASRYAPGGTVGNWRPSRHLISRLTTRTAALLLPEALHGITDPMSGYFLVRRDAAGLERLQPRGYKILLEVLARARPRPVVDVPFTFGRRASGTSKADWRVSLQFLQQVAALRGLQEARDTVTKG